MSALANQSDLIISLSRDKVGLSLLNRDDPGRESWQSTFQVDGIFLEEQIASSLDRALAENTILIDHFDCVSLVILDSPMITLPASFEGGADVAEIAARHLRLRSGDTLNTDITEGESMFCYTLPFHTFKVLREYYSNITCTHLSSLLWKTLSSQSGEPVASRSYYTYMPNSLNVMATRNQKLIFCKTFLVRDPSDVAYFTLACSRMLNTEQQWGIMIQGIDSVDTVPGERIIKFDHQVLLPSLHVLMSQFNPCAS